MALSLGCAFGSVVTGLAPGNAAPPVPLPDPLWLPCSDLANMQGFIAGTGGTAWCGGLHIELAGLQEAGRDQGSLMGPWQPGQSPSR